MAFQYNITIFCVYLIEITINWKYLKFFLCSETCFILLLDNLKCSKDVRNTMRNFPTPMYNSAYMYVIYKLFLNLVIYYLDLGMAKHFFFVEITKSFYWFINCFFHNITLTNINGKLLLYTLLTDNEYI